MEGNPPKWTPNFGGRTWFVPVMKGSNPGFVNGAFIEYSGLATENHAKTRFFEDYGIEAYHRLLRFDTHS